MKLGGLLITINLNKVKDSASFHVTDKQISELLKKKEFIEKQLIITGNEYWYGALNAMEEIFNIIKLKR